jgi:hypothetical protein
MVPLPAARRGPGGRSRAWLPAAPGGAGESYGTEGARTLIRKGFTELGVRRVMAETMAVRTASRRVMEKAGLTLVRTFQAAWPDPIPGDEHGDVEYALTRADWERQQALGHDRARDHRPAHTAATDSPREDA